MAFCASASFSRSYCSASAWAFLARASCSCSYFLASASRGVWSRRQRQPVQWHTGPHLLFVDLSFQCLLLYQYFLFTQFGLAFSPGNLGVDRGGLDGFLLFLFLNLVGSVGLQLSVVSCSLRSSLCRGWPGLAATLLRVSWRHCPQQPAAISMLALLQVALRVCDRRCPATARS